MSGPKTSRYTLIQEQKRILAEQRKIKHKKAIASENIKRNLNKLLQIKEMFSSDKQISSELLNRYGSDGGFSQKLHELQIMITPISSIVEKTNTDDILSLERTLEIINQCIAKSKTLVQEISDIAAQNEKKLQSDLDAAIDSGFSASSANIKATTQQTINETKEKNCLSLIQIRKNCFLPLKLMDEIDAVLKNIEKIQDETFLKNYLALTVVPLIKKCKDYLSEYKEYHKKFETLYTEYIALCNLYYYTAQDYSCSASSIQELQIEIQKIKNTAANDNEQTYISNCLDEVMVEMGYSVLGSREVTKKNGKHFRNELYTYGEGTAVNITYSSDGKIAMELGGMDSTDRLPNEHETSMLCDSMEQFCKDFKEIEKRLLSKGVILADRISLLPPNAEYAQIINTSDYNIKSEFEKLQSKKQHRIMTKLQSINQE